MGCVFATSSPREIASELGSHVSNGTVAAHGCDSAIDDVVRDAVEDSGAAFRWRLNAVALQICVPVGDDDPSRLGVEHVAVQGNNVVTNRRPTADVIPSVSRSPNDIGGVALSKITTVAHDVKVMIDSPLRLLEAHQGLHFSRPTLNDHAIPVCASAARAKGIGVAT
jgi:hypothetical protein